MSWKKDTLVRMVIKLPTCGTLLNMPLQLDFVERLIDNEEEHKKFVLLCERQFNAGVPSHTIYEIIFKIFSIFEFIFNLVSIFKSIINLFSNQIW